MSSSQETGLGVRLMKAMAQTHRDRAFGPVSEKQGALNAETHFKQPENNMGLYVGLAVLGAIRAAQMIHRHTTAHLIPRRAPQEPSQPQPPAPKS